jgi:hypothetical protein
MLSNCFYLNFHHPQTAKSYLTSCRRQPHAWIAAHGSSRTASSVITGDTELQLANLVSGFRIALLRAV